MKAKAVPLLHLRASACIGSSIFRPSVPVSFHDRGTEQPHRQRASVIEKRYDGQSDMPFSKVKIDWTYDALNRLVAETRDADPTPGTDTPEDFGTPEAALGDYTDFFAFDLAGNRLLGGGETTGIRTSMHRKLRAHAAKAQPTTEMRTSFHGKDGGEAGCQERPRGFHVFAR